uniref:Major facilitator superfamily (MFS) profile domain-containing protein n=1 Tax=Oryza nivara TaxID=4536 RepID=A0A0E0GMQ0_ORYNI
MGIVRAAEDVEGAVVAGAAGGGGGGGGGEVTAPLLLRQHKQGRGDEEKIQDDAGGDGGGRRGGGGGGSMSMLMLSTAVAVCGSFEFGTCVGYSAPAQAGIVNDFGLSNSEYGVFGSVLTIGAMIGALTSGRLADSLGRKTTMGLAAIIGIVGWFTIYFANGATMLYLGRVLLGYCTGVLSYVVPVFISEIAPKDLRGGLASSNQLFICSGCSAAYIIGALLSWRSLVLVGLVPCAFLLVGLLFIPESPRWLVSASGTFLGCFLTGLSFYFKAQGVYAQLVPTLALYGISVYYAAYSVGMGPVPWVIMSEIFSIEIKAIAGSLVTLVSWIGSFAISYSFNFLMDWNSAGTFFLFSAASLVTVLFVAREGTRRDPRIVHMTARGGFVCRTLVILSNYLYQCVHITIYILTSVFCWHFNSFFCFSWCVTVLCLRLLIYWSSARM